MQHVWFNSRRWQPKHTYARCISAIDAFCFDLLNSIASIWNILVYWHNSKLLLQCTRPHKVTSGLQKTLSDPFRVCSYKSRLINNAFESRAANRFNISRWAWPHSWKEPTLFSLNALYNTTSISVSIQHSPTCIEEDFQLTPSANTCNSVYLVLELSLDCIQSACEVCAASALCLLGTFTN